jgi:hypothetical protein
MGYRATPAWRGQYLPWGKGPTNYAPLPQPFTMKPPKGLGAVNPANGDITNYAGQVVMNCGDGGLNYWLEPGCWSYSASAWQAMASLKPVNYYVPPVAPSNDAAANAVDTGTESDLISALVTQSADATKAAQLALAQSQGPLASGGGSTSGCDPSSDYLQCLLGMSWYVWALIAGGSLALILAVKKR